MLASIGVLSVSEDRTFQLTALGETLRSDAAHSVRDWALYIDASAPWGHLYEAVKTGAPDFVLAHGVPTYEFLGSHSELSAPFNRWMSKQSAQHNAGIVAAYDFARFAVVADIAGSEGSTLTAVLQRRPSLRGILFDKSSVVADPTALRAIGLRDRCAVIGGDMRECVPAGADLYMTKRDFMIWGDDDAIPVLKEPCCPAVAGRKGAHRRDGHAAAGRARSGPRPSISSCCSRTRVAASGAEFRELFARAGLKLAPFDPNGLAKRAS